MVHETQGDDLRTEARSQRLPERIFLLKYTSFLVLVANIVVHVTST